MNHETSNLPKTTSVHGNTLDLAINTLFGEDAAGRVARLYNTLVTTYDAGFTAGATQERASVNPAPSFDEGYKSGEANTMRRVWEAEKERDQLIAQLAEIAASLKDKETL